MCEHRSTKHKQDSLLLQMLFALSDAVLTASEIDYYRFWPDFIEVQGRKHSQRLPEIHIFLAFDRGDYISQIKVDE